jgi:hypothetical protein
MRLFTFVGLFLLPTLLRGDDFYKWPIEKQVAVSSIIARGEWKLENGVNKFIIAEIIKRESGTYFPFKLGNEYPPGNIPAKPNSDYGDGAIIFLQGSRASMRSLIAVSRGRLRGDQSVPLQTIRETVRKESHEAKPPKLEKPYYRRYLEVHVGPNQSLQPITDQRVTLLVTFSTLIAAAQPVLVSGG